MILNKKNEGTLQVTCLIDEELQKKIAKIRKYKGKRIGWLVRQAVQKYVDGDLEI